MKDLGDIAHPPELSDGRIRLRRLQAADKAAVVKACNDGLIERFCFRVPYPYEESDFMDFLSYNEHFWANELIANWTVVDVESDDLLAMISLDVVALRQAGEIGYWCAPWARGQGVTSAAVRLVRDWAFDELELERLELTTDVDNYGSQRVAQAAGFHREGIMRGYLTARTRRADDVLFGMKHDDPREPVVTLPDPRLEDGRIVVRPFWIEDAPAVQAACDDPDVAHWIYLLPSPYTLADAEEFIADSWRRLVAGGRARLAIADAGGEKLLGSISLDVFADREAAEMGYWIAREARHQRFALAAARLVVRWAFEEIGLERIELLTYPGNAASQALAHRLGFRREGVLRGFLVAEPGKDRAGRVELPAGAEATGRATGGADSGAAPDAVLPLRDDQVQFSLLRDDWAG
jgi:RimJ/RimL family protein N-acetyltransferase